MSVKHADLPGSLVSVAQVATSIALLESSHHCSLVAVQQVLQTFVCRFGYQVIFWVALVNESVNSFEAGPIRTMKELQVVVPTAPSSDRFECASVYTFR